MSTSAGSGISAGAFTARSMVARASVVSEIDELAQERRLLSTAKMPPPFRAAPKEVAEGKRRE
eukprot:8531120-Lingulodinium_polyedra.AAC.1